MAWFQRGKEIEPTSLEQYYADQQSHRAAAWLLALGAFIVTLALVFGIFWGGRWVYRKATHKDNTATTIAPSPAADPFATANIQTPNKSSSNGSSGSSSSNSTNKPQGVVNAPTDSSSSSSVQTGTQAPSVNNSQKSTTPAQTQQIANTGPGSQMAIFLTVTAFGVLMYQIKARFVKNS